MRILRKLKHGMTVLWNINLDKNSLENPLDRWCLARQFPPFQGVAGGAMGKLVFQAIEFGRNTVWAVGREYTLCFSDTGNLEVRRNAGRQLLWQSNTGKRGVTFAMQSDGNLVIYDKHGKDVWASGTFGNDGALLAIEDDGTLAICSAVSKVLWQIGPW